MNATRLKWRLISRIYGKRASMYFLPLQHQNLVSILGVNLNGIWISRAKLYMHTDGQTFMNTSKKTRNRVGVYSVCAASFPVFFSHNNRRARKVATEFIFNLTHQLPKFHSVSCCLSEIIDFMARKSRWLLDIRPFAVILLTFKQHSINGVKGKAVPVHVMKGYGE